MTRADVAQSRPAVLGKENDESKPLNMMRGLQLVISQLPVNFSVLTLIYKKQLTWLITPFSLGDTLHLVSACLIPLPLPGMPSETF